MVVLYIKNEVNEFIKIPLYSDENIFYENKLTSGEEIGSIFNDATNSFTIPADDVTNELFKDIYEIGSFNSFNSQKRVDAYIEFNTIPFRFGEVQLEGFQKKDGLIDNYKITFYGNLLQLDDLFGDDDLSEVFGNEDEFDLQWNVNNIRDLLSLPVEAKNRNNQNLNSEVIVPLILIKEEGEDTDITTPGGAIQPKDIRPAIRTRNIINKIASKYGIEFTSDFFDKPQFQNLYTWLNGSDEIKTESQIITDLPQPNLNIENDPGSFTIGGDNDEVFQIRISNNFIQANRQGTGEDLHILSTNIYFRDITVNNQLVPYRFRFYNADTNQLVGETDTFVGNQTQSVIIGNNPSQNRIINTLKFRPSEFSGDYVLNYYIEVIADVSLDFTFQIDSSCNYLRPSFTFFPPLFAFRSVDNSTFNSQTVFQIKDNVPDISVKDFFTDLLKQFNLIIRPISQTAFKIENISDYYRNGNIINISEFVDLDTIEGRREEVVRKLSLLYAENEQEANILLGGQVGNLTKVFNVDNKEEDEIEFNSQYPVFVPQINPVDGGLGNTQLNIALYKEYPSDVVNFYYNGLVQVDANDDFVVRLNVYGTTLELTTITLSDTSDSQEFLQVTNELSFEERFNYFHGSVITNNTYNNFWEEYINALYRNEQILLDVKAFIDWNVIEELDLNSELIIGNEKYLIQDYKINLLNGETDFTLFPTYINKFIQIDNSVSNSQFNFNTGGGYSSFTINTNSSFFIEVAGIDTQWLTLFKTSGTGTTEISFKVSENVITQPRFITIRVSIGSDIFDIKVRQDGVF